MIENIAEAKLRNHPPLQGVFTAPAATRSAPRRLRGEAAPLRAYAEGFDFRGCAAIGTVVLLDAQSFEIDKKRAAVRKDGTATTLLDWRSECPDCETSFTQTTGLAFHNFNRRCDCCKKPAKPVKGRRGRRVKVEVVAA